MDNNPEPSDIDDDDNPAEYDEDDKLAVTRIAATGNNNKGQPAIKEMPKDVDEDE